MVEGAVGLLALLSLTAAGPLQRFPRESEDYQNTDFSAYANFTANEVCFSDNEVFQKGDMMPNPGPCEECRCEPPSIVCNMVKCPVNNNGCQTIQRPNQCCPDYNCECDYNGQLYNDGERIDVPEEPCKVCYCKGGDVMCTSIQCYKRDDCEPRLVTGQCCPKYENCPIRNGNGTNTDKNGAHNKTLNHSLKKEMQPWLLTKSILQPSSSPSLKETETSTSTTEKENIILYEHKKTIEEEAVSGHSDSKFDHTDRPYTVTDVQDPTTTQEEKDITSNLEESISLEKSETVAPVDEVIFTRIDMLHGHHPSPTIIPSNIIADGFTNVVQGTANDNNEESYTRRATTGADVTSTPSIQTEGYTLDSLLNVAQKDSIPHSSIFEKEKENDNIKLVASSSPTNLVTASVKKTESFTKDEFEPSTAVETLTHKVLPQDAPSLFVAGGETERVLIDDVTESNNIKSDYMYETVAKESDGYSNSHSEATIDIGPEFKEKNSDEEKMGNLFGMELTNLGITQESTTNFNNIQSDEFTNMTEEPKTSVKLITQNTQIENLSQSLTNVKNDSPSEGGLNKLGADFQDGNSALQNSSTHTTPSEDIDTTSYHTEDNVNGQNIEFDTVECKSEECNLNGGEYGTNTETIIEGVETTTESDMETTNEVAFTKLYDQDVPNTDIDNKVKASDSFKHCNDLQCNNNVKRSSINDGLLSTIPSLTTLTDLQKSESLKNDMNEINTNRDNVLKVDTTLYLTEATSIHPNIFENNPKPNDNDYNSLKNNNRYSIEEVTSSPNHKRTIYISDKPEHHDIEVTNTPQSMVENVKYDDRYINNQSILKNVDKDIETNKGEQVVIGSVIYNDASIKRKDVISDAPPILDLNSHVPFLQLGGHSSSDDFSDMQEELRPTESTGDENKVIQEGKNEFISNPESVTLNRLEAETDFTTILFTTAPPLNQEELNTNTKLYKDAIESKDITTNMEMGSTVATSHIPLTPGDLKMLAEYLINEKIMPIKTNGSKYIPNPWLKGNLTSEESMATILTAANVSIGLMNYTSHGTATPEAVTNPNDLIKSGTFEKETLLKGNNVLQKGNPFLNKTSSVHTNLNENDNLSKKYVKPISSTHDRFAGEELTTDSTLYEVFTSTLETVTDMSSEKMREKAVLLSSVTGEDLEKFAKDLKANISNEMTHTKYDGQTLTSGTRKDNEDIGVVITEEVSNTSQIVPIEKHHHDIANNEPASASEADKTKAEEYSLRNEQYSDSGRKANISDVLQDTTLKDSLQTSAVFP